MRFYTHSKFYVSKFAIRNLFNFLFQLIFNSLQPQARQLFFGAVGAEIGNKRKAIIPYLNIVRNARCAFYFHNVHSPKQHKLSKDELYAFPSFRFFLVIWSGKIILKNHHMKKIYALLLILVGITSNSFALSGGPDAYGYTWRDINDPNGPVYNWIDIAGITGAVDVKPLGDDNTVGALQIGFPFHFYWYDVTQVWVGSDGFIAFGNDNLASPFYTIPSTTQPDNCVAAMLSDLNFDGVGNLAQCWLWRSPTNDTCIISWINVPFWQVNAPYYTGSNTFQIILNNNDSSITFQYQQQSGLSSGAVSNYMTVGIENISGSVGLQVLHDPLNLGGYYLTTPYAIKFYYPPSTTYIANDAEAHWTGNAISGGIFLSRNSPPPYQMVAAIKNTGNINTSPFNTNCKILNSVNTTVVQDNATVSLLTPAQVQVLTMSNTFNPTTSGTYKMITTTSLAGDSVPSNNIDSLEIVVVDTSQLNIRLSYDDNTANGPGLNWNGGNGGARVQFVPPFFPCRV